MIFDLANGGLLVVETHDIQYREHHACNMVKNAVGALRVVIPQYKNPKNDETSTPHCRGPQLDSGIDVIKAIL